MGLKGALTNDPKALLKTYLSYELSRIKPLAKRDVRLDSLLLHQLVTDMALALDLEWVFKLFIEYLNGQDLTPGFNTGNFTYLVKKFNEWKIDLNQVLVAAPFNSVGFQMIPSREECEVSLKVAQKPFVIAISVLGAGFVSPADAAKYIASLPNIRGVAVGISKEKHALETFRFFKNVGI